MVNDVIGVGLFVALRVVWCAWELCAASVNDVLSRSTAKSTYSPLIICSCSSIGTGTGSAEWHSGLAVAEWATGLAAGSAAGLAVGSVAGLAAGTCC